MIARTLTSALERALAQFPLVSVSGPRQAGKTTLARAVRPDYAYVNLDLPQLRDYAREDPLGFLTQYRGGVVLDEVQRVPELFPYLKHVTDERGDVGEYILTGSQHFLLLERITESLAGRVAALRLLPLSLSELHQGGFGVDSWQAASWRGGYPRMYDADIHPGDFFPSYVGTYVERDVRLVTQVRQLSTFRDFLALCAGRVGQLLNLTELGNNLGVDAKTVRGWISVLEATFVAYRLPPYFENFDRRIVKSPKLYFYDTGLACHLLGIESPRQLDTHFARGALFENAVVNELRKRRLHAGREPRQHFYRDSNQREIDLVQLVGGHLEATEIKAARTLNARFFGPLRTFRGLATRPGREVFTRVIYAGDEAQTRADTRVIPWGAFAAGSEAET